MKTPFLIAPCSTPTPRRAFQGRAQKITCYQDEAFKALLGRAMGGLQDVFQTKNEVLILPGGETGALEGAVEMCIRDSPNSVATSISMKAASKCFLKGPKYPNRRIN